MEQHNIHFATYPPEKGKYFATLMPQYPKKAVVRLGGTMDYEKYPIQINSVKATMNCINKMTQKELLAKAKLSTLPFFTKPEDIKKLEYPFVIKGKVRSKGTSVFIVENDAELAAYRKITGDFYAEPLFVATSEYRLHCTQTECFFSVKKIKKEFAENEIIIKSTNHYNVREFAKPRLWKQMVADSIAAVKAMGMDIAAVDVGYDSKYNGHRFAIHEVNSNPELLHNTFEAYKIQIDNLIKKQLK